MLRTTHCHARQVQRTRAENFFLRFSRELLGKVFVLCVYHQGSPSRWWSLSLARARTHAISGDDCANVVPRRRCCCRLPDLAVGTRAHGSEQLVPLRYLPFRPVDLDLVKLRHASPARVALAPARITAWTTAFPSLSRSPGLDLYRARHYISRS